MPFVIQPFFSAERLPICRFLQRSIILLFNIWRCFLLLIWLGNELFTLQYKINDEQNMKYYNLIWKTRRKKRMTIRKKFPNRYLSFLIYESVSTVQGHMGSNIHNSYFYLGSCRSPAVLACMVEKAAWSHRTPSSPHCPKTFQQKFMLTRITANRTSFQSLYKEKIPYFASVKNFCCI